MPLASHVSFAGSEVQPIFLVGLDATTTSTTAGAAAAAQRYTTQPTGGEKRPGARLRTKLAASPEGRQALQHGRQVLGRVLAAEQVSPMAALRLSHGFSQADLAQATAIPQPQLSRLENGVHDTVQLGTARRIAEALALDLDTVATAMEAAISQRRARAKDA